MPYAYYIYIYILYIYIYIYIYILQNSYSYSYSYTNMAYKMAIVFQTQNAAFSADILVHLQLFLHEKHYLGPLDVEIIRNCSSRCAKRL